jgi:hypothetical protein
MMPPPPNRVPKFKAPNPPSASYLSSSTIPQSGFNHDLNSKPDENVGASASELIQMAANQCLQESAANPLQPNKKVNTQAFQSMKFAENKKRAK